MNNDPQQPYSQPPQQSVQYGPQPVQQPYQPQPNPYTQQPQAPQPVYQQQPVAPLPQQMMQPGAISMNSQKPFPIWAYLVLGVVVLASIALAISVFILM